MMYIPVNKKSIRPLREQASDCSDGCNLMNLPEGFPARDLEGHPYRRDIFGREIHSCRPESPRGPTSIAYEEQLREDYRKYCSKQIAEAVEQGKDPEIFLDSLLPKEYQRYKQGKEWELERVLGILK